MKVGDKVRSIGLSYCGEIGIIVKILNNFNSPYEVYEVYFPNLREKKIKIKHNLELVQ